MRPEALDLLACPACAGPLELSAEEREGGEVLSGELACSACRASYPITQGIPCLLPPRLSGREKHIYMPMLAYYDAYSSIMDRCYHNPVIAYMRRVEDACIRLTEPRGRVLDIGCGTGRQTLLLARLGCEVLALDISFSMLLAARENAARAGLADRVAFVQALADALPIRPSAFDRAYSIFGAYNHAPRYLRGFRQVWRALRPGGRFLLTVLNKHQLTWWVETIMKKRGRQLKQRLKSDLCYLAVRYGRRKKRVWTRLFTARKLRRALRRAGFEGVRVGSVLIFLRPRFSYEPGLELRGLEARLAELEERLRWLPPFSHLGAYLIALATRP